MIFIDRRQALNQIGLKIFVARARNQIGLKTFDAKSLKTGSASNFLLPPFWHQEICSRGVKFLCRQIPMRPIWFGTFLTGKNTCL